MIQTDKLLRELVALPSVNPAFLPDGDGRAGERRIAEFLATVAAGTGLDVDLEEVLPQRPNLVARLQPAGKARRRIVLAPHLDTVPPATAEQLVPRQRNGRLFGRGACDTKGSVTAMLAAVADVAERGRRPRETEIVFVGMVDEENAQAGSRAFVDSGVRADLAIVGEPTRLRIVTAHKGSLWLQLETRGRAAHGSRPELGRNAIHTMARVVDVLETRYAATLKRRRHALLGAATVSVGMIQGGTQPNIVPDACTIVIDRRSLPGETERSVRVEIADFLAQRGLRVTFSNRKFAPCPAMETDPDEPLVRQFLASVGQRAPVGVNFFCDAAILAEGGIPSVAFGPGDIAVAHTAEEWISLTSLERARQLLAKFLRTLP